MRHEVPPGDVGLGDARLLGEEGDQVALGRVAQAPQGLEVALPVQGERVVRRAVEVDGELGHPQQRPVDVHQAGGAVAQRQPSGDAEVAVEPAVEQRAAVDLDGDLAPAVRAEVGLRLDPEVGGVGVRADHAERGVRRGALGHVPGDDGAAAHHVPPAGAAAGAVLPPLGFLDPAESGRVQPLGHGGRGVVRRGRGSYERGQVVGVPAVERRVLRGHGSSLVSARFPPHPAVRPVVRRRRHPTAVRPDTTVCRRPGRAAAHLPCLGQNASSGRSMTSSVTASASARAVPTSGRTVAAKNFAAATLPA